MLAGVSWARVFDLAVPLLTVVVWAIALTLAAWGGGHLCWRVVGRQGRVNASDGLQILALGMGTLMLVAGFAGTVGAFRGWFLLPAFAVLAARGGVLLARGLPRRFPLCFASGWWILSGVPVFLTALAVTTPAAFFDQWHYHLAFPFQWLREGRITVFPEHVYSFFPANMGLLFSYGLAGPGAWAAQVTNWWMALASGLGAALLARRAGCRPSLAALAAVFFLSAPTVLEMSVTAGADLGVAFFLVAAGLAVRDAVTPRTAGNAAIRAGVFAGLALGCKYLAAITVAIPVAVMLVLVALLRNRVDGVKKSLCAGAVCTASALLVFLPWMARNTVLTGNPLHPYLEHAIGSDDASAGIPGDLARRVGGIEVNRDRLLALVTLGTVNPKGHMGDPGPVFLWLMPLWVLGASTGRYRVLLRVLLAGFLLGVCGWALAPPLGRYLAPLLALAAAGSAAGFAGAAAKWRPWLRTSALVLLVSACLSNLNPARAAYLGPQLRGALGSEDPDLLFRRHHSGWGAVVHVNERLPRDARVLLVSESRVWGLERSFHVQDPFRQPLLVQLAKKHRDDRAIILELRRRGFSHVFVNWSEMNRMEVMHGETGLFQTSEPDVREVLRELFSEQLSPVFSDGSAAIFRVPDPKFE